MADAKREDSAVLDLLIKAKVTKRMADGKPPIPHADVFAGLTALHRS